MTSAQRSFVRRAFSLIELFVVIGVISLLMGLILPAIQRAREAASRTVCLSNMRQIGFALHNYHNDYGRFPPVMVRFPPPAGSNYGAAVSWRVPLLPYLEQDALWLDTIQACQQDPNADHNPPHVGMSKVVRVFVCPSDSRLLSPLTDPISGISATYTSYLGVMGGTKADGVFAFYPPRGDGTRFAEITDGSSNTLAVGERPPPDNLMDGWWYSLMCSTTGNSGCRGPAGALTVEIQPPLFRDCGSSIYYGPGRLNNPCDALHFWSLHSGGANFLFADASVRPIPYQAREVMRALATRAGGEAVAVPE